MVIARNLLVGAGAYYISGWLSLPLSLGFGKLTQGLTYSGDFNTAVVAPLVIHVPKAIVAAAAGATVVWLVESDRPVSWAIFPRCYMESSVFLDTTGRALPYFSTGWARQWAQYFQRPGGGTAACGSHCFPTN
jgi:hypothetical protein